MEKVGEQRKESEKTSGLLEIFELLIKTYLGFLSSSVLGR